MLKKVVKVVDEFMRNSYFKSFGTAKNRLPEDADGKEEKKEGVTEVMTFAEDG